MGELKQMNIKNRTYYFTMPWLILKIFSQTCLKSTENHTKTLVFTTLYKLQVKKLMIMKIFTVWILCISNKKMKINTSYFTLQMKIKIY